MAPAFLRRLKTGPFGPDCCCSSTETESRQSPGRVQAESRQSPGRVQAESRQSPGRVQAESRQSPGRVSRQSVQAECPGRVSRQSVQAPRAMLLPLAPEVFVSHCRKTPLMSSEGWVL
uniref:Uncharacterized protein n=1 Tax=Knipowitschia caucasica TaxID=637954 RepID=A0AAV2J7N7_KNICA